MTSENKQSALTDFSSPDSERSLFRHALENVLSAYSEEYPSFPFDSDEDDVDNITDHRTDFGSNYSQTVSRLRNRCQNTSYEVHSETALGFDKLRAILEEPTASLPLVELHPEYFEYEEGYRSQPGHMAFSLDSLLIPLSLEDGAIFYYDPILDYYSDVEEDVFGRSMKKELFRELWSRSGLTRWALWINKGAQQTLVDIQEENNEY